MFFSSRDARNAGGRQLNRETEIQSDSETERQSDKATEIRRGREADAGTASSSARIAVAFGGELGTGDVGAAECGRGGGAAA